MSLELPTPFCRIDFLFSAGCMYFGELTFNSGGPGSFYEQWDSILGKAFRRGKRNLMQDLIDGKRFECL